MTICINLYSGPGVGKSTLAASLFAELKKSQIECELITEFAKRKVWEGNTTCLTNQLYITAKQQYMMWCVSQHVNVIVTDSPLLLGCIYGNDDLLNQIILREHYKFDNIDLFLTRNPKVEYQPSGRNQTLCESMELDTKIRGMLETVNPNFITITTETPMSELVSLVKSRIASTSCQIS